MRRSVKIWVPFRLLLHLELCEQCLLKFCLLGRANRLARMRLHIELIEQVLIKVVAIESTRAAPKVHIVIRAICALMAQSRID